VELLSASSLLEAHPASFIVCFIIMVFVALAMFVIPASLLVVLGHLVHADLLFVLLF